MDLRETIGNKTITEQEKRAAMFKAMQDEIKTIDEINKQLRDGKIEEKEKSEEYREPLAVDLRKEIKITLSTGGPADGFTLYYYRDELQGGVYWFADWGTYDEIELNDEEAQKIEDFYLYSDPSFILNPDKY